MRVLEINAVYGHRSTGTIVRNIEQLCWQSGIECFIATPDKTVLKAKNGYVIGNVFDHKLHAFFCRINGRQAYFSRLATRKLLNHIDKIQPDIVHMHNLHNNYIHLNMLLKYLAKKDIRTVITMHDCWFFTGGCFHFAAAGCDKWTKSCGSCPKKKTDTPAYFCDYSSKILADRKKYLTAIPRLTIVGASEWVANECRKSVLKDCDIRFIHNGFDLTVFKPTPSEFRKELGIEGKFVILAPASKWYSAVNKLTFDYFVSHLEPDMVMVLFGCSSLRSDLPDNVKEVGYIRDPHRMVALYSMADVFVNCTREDTFPGVNLECQACGTPVVTYDATGCKETVDGECGIAVKTGDYEALFEAMMKTRQSGDINMDNCLKRVRDNFEIQGQYRKYIDLFKETNG